MGNPFETFKHPGSSDAELHEAAERLGGVVESPSFWSGIANDASMPEAHRRMALIQLFSRHVIPGATTVGRLTEMLDGAQWLKAGDVTAITALGGKVPVKWSPDDTVIAIALPGSDGAIYLAIAGRFTAEEIAAALVGTLHDERALSALIREKAVWPAA